MEILPESRPLEASVARHARNPDEIRESYGSELIIDTDSPQQQRSSMRQRERSVLRKTFPAVDSKL